MKQGAVNFFSEGVSYKIKHKLKIKKWVRDTIRSEGFVLDELNFILCSDEYLLEINKQYLNHSTYTDIITFDNSSLTKSILGDIFISIDRVCENAASYAVSETDELHRIIIHGTLHLLGYTDKPKKKKVLMTALENKYLALRSF